MENNRLRSDMKKLRESMLEEDDSEQHKVLVEQCEVLQDELERRREECIQLRTILANVSLDNNATVKENNVEEVSPENSEELLTAYETQKNVIAQLQDQLSEQSTAFKEAEVMSENL